jgi:5-methylcytosine-specific restriction endonuclease McrA
MPYSDNKLDKIWNRAPKVRGKNPNTHRRDSAGHEIYKPSYGKTSSMGWEVDHKKPRSKGGTNSIRNLEPRHWKSNRRKGNDY